MVKPISPRQLQLGLAVAIILQIAIVGLFYLDVIHDPNHQPGTLLFHQGGDQDGYFALAQSIVSGDLIQSKYTLGYPLLLVPWMAIFKPARPQDLIPAIAALNAFVLFPLSQFILARLTLRITHHRTVALISVLLWTGFPVMLYSAMALVGRAELGAIWAVHLPWLQMLSDPPATFLTLLSFWLLLLILATPASRRYAVLVVVLGAVCGFSLLLRVNTILSVGIVILLLMLKRRWSALFVVGLLSFALFLPQFLYNMRYFGGPLTMGYQVMDQQPSDGLFSLTYPIKILTGQYGFVLGGGLLLLCALLTLGGAVLWRRDRDGAVILTLWIVSYLVFYGLYYYSWEGALTRFLLPVYPGLASLVSALLLVRAPAHSAAEHERSQPA